MAENRGVIVMIGGDPEDWGLIPNFLDLDDPRGAVEQFNEKYITGWHDFPGFTFDIIAGTLSYPGDPPYRVISCIQFRNELILLFPSAWVLVLQPNQTWRVSRMD